MNISGRIKIASQQKAVNKWTIKFNLSFLYVWLKTVTKVRKNLNTLDLKFKDILISLYRALHLKEVNIA